MWASCGARGAGCPTLPPPALLYSDQPARCVCHQPAAAGPRASCPPPRRTDAGKGAFGATARPAAAAPDRAACAPGAPPGRRLLPRPPGARRRSRAPRPPARQLPFLRPSSTANIRPLPSAAQPRVHPSQSFRRSAPAAPQQQQAPFSSKRPAFTAQSRSPLPSPPSVIPSSQEQGKACCQGPRSRRAGCRPGRGAAPQERHAARAAGSRLCTQCHARGAVKAAGQGRLR
jgi:hypothetical protein